MPVQVARASRLQLYCKTAAPYAYSVLVRLYIQLYYCKVVQL